MAEASARILLVDDEESIQTLLAYPLRQEGSRSSSPATGARASIEFAEGRFDLVVLDVMMPRIDGIEVCRKLRARSQVPIIMLTARDDEVDKVLGLEIGADDYITKPFSVREFRSRVKAALRRTRFGGDDVGEGPITVGEMTVDPSRRQVTVRGERPSSPTSSSRSSRRSRAAPGASSTVPPCSSGSGATAPTATRARSTSTSAICGRRSRTSPSSPSTCSRCAASATGSATRIRRRERRCRRAARPPADRQRPDPAGAAVLRDHRDRDRVRLPLRRPPAQLQPDVGAARAARAAGRRGARAAADGGRARPRAARAGDAGPRAAPPTSTRGSRCSASARASPPS